MGAVSSQVATSSSPYARTSFHLASARRSAAHVPRLFHGRRISCTYVASAGGLPSGVVDRFAQSWSGLVPGLRLAEISQTERPAGTHGVAEEAWTDPSQPAAATPSPAGMPSDAIPGAVSRIRRLIKRGSSPCDASRLPTIGAGRGPRSQACSRCLSGVQKAPRLRDRISVNSWHSRALFRHPSDRCSQAGSRFHHGRT